MPCGPGILNEPFTSLTPCKQPRAKHQRSGRPGTTFVSPQLRPNSAKTVVLYSTSHVRTSWRQVGLRPNLSVGSPCGTWSIVQLVGEVRNSLDWPPCTSRKPEASNRSPERTRNVRQRDPGPCRVRPVGPFGLIGFDRPKG